MKQFILLTAILTSSVVNAQQIMPLYSNELPNSITLEDQEYVTNERVMIIHKVSRPTLTAYLPDPEVANGTAIIIFPGGGYGVLAAGHEGVEVAKELNKAGIAAFVVKYRIPDNATMDNKEIGPLQDAQQAIKTVRIQANEFNIDPGKVGIMGFSAGGHLASTAGTHYTKALIDNADNINLRPDFMILAYPVISFQDSLTHMGSRNNLLGENPSVEKKDYYSNELQVNADTPPTFLVHASDDRVVKVGNSLAFYERLIEYNVPAEMHIYQQGGHGFGMHLPKSQDLWLDRCKNWMAVNGLAKR
ncbi:MAG: alpha/beta hydrolase [Fulvivirga sp.]